MIDCCCGVMHSVVFGISLGGLLMGTRIALFGAFKF